MRYSNGRDMRIERGRRAHKVPTFVGNWRTGVVVLATSRSKNLG